LYGKEQAVHTVPSQGEEIQMAKDYYLILGVSPDATLNQIKSAYRREAKRLHPDHSGEGSEPFQTVQEAYEVLGDPGRRQAYDDELAREKRKAQLRARKVRPEPLRQRRCPIEPLVPTGRPSGPREAFPKSSFPTLIEELFRRPWSNQPTPIWPEAGREVEEIHVQVSLTRKQALHGGRIRVWIPVRSRCPSCRGQGGTGFFECLHCFGSGAVVDEYPVDIAFPGGLVDGFTGRVSLSRPGMRDLSMILHFRMDEW
jgi:DnaJ-class molecular chaperone